MADVFISYSRVDSGFVRKIADSLKAHNRDAWVDWQDIPPTAKWMEEIYSGIDEAHNFAFVIGPESVRSQRCTEEIVHAVQSHKRLIPILHRAVPDATLPDVLAEINFVLFRDSDDFEKAVETLLEALDTDLESKKAHTRLLVRAKEWERKGNDRSLLLRGEDLREAEQWQAGASGKTPAPVPLQSQYIHASRQAETRRQRLTLSLTGAALVVTIGLAIVAILQRNAARRETAIADARQLAAQAELARTTSPEASALLSVESSRLATVQENTAAINKTLPLLRKAELVLAHSDGVETIAFSPDGQYLATGCVDGTARLVALRSGKVLSFRAGDLVASVAFSPDSRYLAIGSWDGSATVTEISDPNHPVVLRNSSGTNTDKFNGRVSSVSFSPNGKYLATGSWDNSARIFEVGSWKQLARVEHKSIVNSVAWDPESRYVVSGGGPTAEVFGVHGESIRTLPFNDVVEAVAFSRDGKYVAAGSWDHTARVFAADSWKLIARLELENQVQTVAFSPDSRYLLTGAQDNTARVFEIPTGKEIARVTHRLVVNSVAWSPDGKSAASASADGTAFIFDAMSGKPLAFIEHVSSIEGGLTAVAFSPDGRYVATGGFDGSARISPFADSLSHSVRMDHRGQVLTVALSSDGQYLATGTWDDTVLISDTTNGATKGELRFDGAIYAIGFSPDGEQVAAADDGLPGKLMVARAQNGEVLMSRAAGETPRALSFSRDGHILAAPGDHGDLDLIDVAKGTRLKGLPHEETPDSAEEILGTAFSNDSRFVATSRTDGILRVFETTTGNPVARFSKQRWAMSMVFSPDDRYLLQRLNGNSAQVVEVKSGRVIRQFSAQGGVLAVAYSPDGHYFAAGTGDKSVYVVDMLDGRTMARLESVGPVKAVAFSRDGRHVVSAASENEGSADLTMVVRSDLWSTGDLATQVCAVLNRNLSQAEWGKYFPGQGYRKTCLTLPVPDSSR